MGRSTIHEEKEGGGEEEEEEEEEENGPSEKEPLFILRIIHKARKYTSW
jgi:hypothetical protein